MTTTPTRALTPLTDTRGVALTLDILDEPGPGSVVLSDGEFGTAWQRFFSDGLWYSARGGRAKDWTWLITRRNLVLVYSARERFQKRDES